MASAASDGWPDGGVAVARFMQIPSFAMSSGAPIEGAGGLSIGQSDWVPLIAVGISVSGKNLANSSVDGRRPAHDGVGVAMRKMSNPGWSYSSARLTAWASSQASMYAHKFYLRVAGLSSKDGNLV